MQSKLDLNGKQIKCYTDSKNIDYNALSILQMLYPNYQTVTTVFDIYPDIPFIYIGDLRYVKKVKERKEPYILVATTGDYDFTDRETLLKVAYLHHGKEVPKYIQEIYKTWSNSQFYYNLKLIILLGVSIDKELEEKQLLLNVINNATSPIRLVKDYLRDIETESTEYLENDLLSFIDRSSNINKGTTKNKKSLKVRTTFYQVCNKNIKIAVDNLVNSNIENLDLRNLNFILDLVWSTRNGGDNL